MNDLQNLKELYNKINEIFRTNDEGLFGACSMVIKNNRLSIDIPYVAVDTECIQQISELFQQKGYIDQDPVSGGIIITFYMEDIY